VLPSKRHRPGKKGSGQSHHLERLNATLRARLVGKTLSFSKSLRNLIGALWLFIHDNNHHVLHATT
jgi:IS1 family transposase